MSTRKNTIVRFAGYTVATLLMLRGLFLGGLPVAYAAVSAVQDEAKLPLTTRVFCVFSRWFNTDAYETQCRPVSDSETPSPDTVVPDPKEEDKKRGQTDQEVLDASINFATARDEEIRREIARLEQELGEVRAARLSVENTTGAPLPVLVPVSPVEELIENRIQVLRNEMVQKFYLAARSPSRYSPGGGNFLPLSGGTLTGALTGTSATFSTLSVLGDTILNGVTYVFPAADGTNGQVLTTNGSGTLSWTTASGGGFGGGELVAEYITATSSTATSTFAGDVSIATDKQYRINGTPVLSRPSANNALIIGDHSGNARGTYAIDMQAYRFSADNVASGNFSFAAGYRAKASGNYSAAAGYYVFATGERSSAFGHGTGAPGNYAFAAGYQSDAIANSSVAVGNGSFSRGDYSSAIGVNAYTGTGADNSVALGKSARATADNSVAVGNLSEADGVQSLAVGVGTGLSANANRATAYRSIAVGFKNNVVAEGASAFGSTIANTTATSTMIGPSDAAKMTILGAAGSVGFTGIGTTTPNYLLHVQRGSDGDVAAFTDTNGTCTVNPTNTALVCSSDERLKEDITSISGETALEKLRKIAAVTFKWKTQDDETKRYGFIAQDVEKVLPEFVETRADGYKGVSLNSFIPVLTAALKELDARVSLMSASLGTTVTTTVLSLKELIVERFTARTVTTDELCVGTTCLTEEDLQALLNNAHRSGHTADESSDEISATEPPPTDENSDADAAPEDTTGEPPAEEDVPSDETVATTSVSSEETEGAEEPASSTTSPTDTQ